MLEQLKPGHIGFLLAAAGYLMFWGLQLTVKVKTAQKQLLGFYTLLSVVWAFHNSQTESLPFVDIDSFLIESCHKILLAVFLLAALNRTDITLQQLVSPRKIQVLLITFGLWLIIGSVVLPGLGLRLLATLVLTVFMLAMVETLYRQSGQQKWQFKPMIIALGICLLLDFYLLAEAALLGKVNQQTWQARGFVHLVMLPFLIIAVKRIKSWGINVYVSRDIVLQSSLVLAAGFYLCVLAVVGYYLSYIGGSWTSLLQVVFVVTGTAVLSVLLFSEGIRRKAKVFIEKHFFANTFDYREKWVELTLELKQIEIAQHNAPEICLNAWCKAIGYSDGALLKLQHGNLMQLAQHGELKLTSEDLAAIDLYQQTFVQQNWLLDFSDHKDRHVQSILQQLELKKLSFSLLIPIFHSNLFWGCCLLEPQPNQKLPLNWELRDYLNAVTEQVSGYLFMSEASQVLSENAQFIAFSRMSAFVVHDLKNVKAQIDMLLKNAKKHRHNPEFVDDAFQTIEAMQSRLQNMLSQLTNKQHNSEHIKLIKLSNVVQQVISERCASSLPLPKMEAVQELALKLDAERFSNVLFHLIDNAQQATADSGEVFIKLSQVEQMACIEISDTGCGMTTEFINERLFRPFDTTKGNAGMGIGAYDAQTFALQQQGRLTVVSEVGLGTTFTMLLPLH